MKLDIFQNPQNQTTTIQIILERLFDEKAGDVIKEVIEQSVNKLSEQFLQEHSSKIMSQINIKNVVNLTTIELGKRAAKEVEKK